MATLTIVFDDHVMIKDGYKRASFKSDADKATLEAKRVSLGHQTVRAIQWDGSNGECEHSNGQSNSTITQADIDQYFALFEPQYISQTKTHFLNQDAGELAREIRDGLLSETDWWANSDLTMTQAQIDYRRDLRDLPSTSDWNPTLTWDDATWNGSLSGVTWPTKP